MFHLGSGRRYASSPKSAVRPDCESGAMSDDKVRTTSYAICATSTDMRIWHVKPDDVDD